MLFCVIPESFGPWYVSPLDLEFQSPTLVWEKTSEKNIKKKTEKKQKYLPFNPNASKLKMKFLRDEKNLFKKNQGEKLHIAESPEYARIFYNSSYFKS